MSWLSSPLRNLDLKTLFHILGEKINEFWVWHFSRHSPGGDERDEEEQDDPYLCIEEPRDQGPVDTHGAAETDQSLWNGSTWDKEDDEKEIDNLYLTNLTQTKITKTLYV